MKAPDPAKTQKAIREYEKSIVDGLGKQIGFGNMMTLASECWKEKMIEDGYGDMLEGVFIPALPSQVRPIKKYSFSKFWVKLKRLVKYYIIKI